MGRQRNARSQSNSYQTFDNSSWGIYCMAAYCVHACMPACLHACMPACLHACQPDRYLLKCPGRSSLPPSAVFQRKAARSQSPST